VFRRRSRGDADQGEAAELAEDEDLAGDPDGYEGDLEDEYADDEYADDEDADDEYGEDADDEDADDEDAGDEYPEADELADEPGAEALSGAARGGRRSRGRASRRGADERHDLGDPATWTRMRDPAAAAEQAGPSGPWDSESEYPEAARMDFGSMLVPARDGYDVQILISEDAGIAISVVRGESALQIGALAAPKRSGIWSEVMEEISADIADAGGSSHEQSGPFGRELIATVSPIADGVQLPPQDLRFLGADGPRWFLRGLLSGPAASDPQQAAAFEEIFADIVVVRGEHAMPPQQPLPIELPEEYREAIEGQLAEQQPDGFNPFENPFERGPEITETR
jgi:Protein of unknown function (DUF3710)